MMRMLVSRTRIVHRSFAVTRHLSSGRIVVNPPTKASSSTTARSKSKLEQRKESLLIKTNLEQHLNYLKSQRLDPNAPPSDIPNALGIVDRDLTEEMIDVSGMYDPRLHLPNAPRHWIGYEEATPLSSELVAHMAVRGQPLTVADFMRQALTHEQFGYYTNPTPSHHEDDWDDEEDNGATKDNHNDDIDDDHDADDWDTPKTTTTTPDNFIIGRQGDFVTAPEVSQVFGECLAVWFVTQFNESLTSKQKQQGVQLVEVGPGKGTLIQDVLRSCCSLSDTMQSAIRHVHLVEASPAMRQEQYRKLQELKLTDPTIRIVFDDGRDDTDDDCKIDGIEKDETNQQSSSIEKDAAASSSSSSSSKNVQNQKEQTQQQVITVRWHDTFSNFVAATSDNAMATFVVCQEFIDALPVHVFEKTDGGWRERMIDVAIQEEEETKTTKDALESKPAVVAAAVPVSDEKPKKEEKKTRLRVVVSPNVSPACKTLLNVDEATGHMTNDNSPVGTVCEVCPEGILLVQDIAKLLERHGGAALIVDYGNDKGATDSLRGFSRHEQVSFLSRPGQVDVTADVDFQALRHAVNYPTSDSGSSADAPFAFGPVTQGDFLAAMGAVERVVSLIENDDTTDEQADDLYSALERLILPDQMGTLYKVMAIGRKKDGIFAPPGFS